MGRSDLSKSPGAVRGWVLYDGQCGVCRTFVPRWTRSLRRRGFVVAPLQEPWVADHLRGRGEDPFRDFRLLLADGRLLSGADVYRFLLRDRWWTRPVYWLTRLPVCAWLFDSAYRRFADRRHAISASCGLTPPASAADDERAPGSSLDDVPEGTVRPVRFRGLPQERAQTGTEAGGRKAPEHG